MNRVLKKAASFLAAVVVGASALTAGGSYGFRENNGDCNSGGQE